MTKAQLIKELKRFPNETEVAIRITSPPSCCGNEECYCSDYEIERDTFYVVGESSHKKVKGAKVLAKKIFLQS